MILSQAKPKRSAEDSYKRDDTVLIRDLMDSVPEVTPDTPCRHVKDILRDDEPIGAVVVTLKGRPEGLVMSLHLDRVLSQQFGVAVYYDRPISKVMDRKPLLVQTTAALELVAKLAMDRETSKIYDHIVVVEEGFLAGIVSVRKILDALLNLQKTRANDLSVVNKRLKMEVDGRKNALNSLRESREMLQLVIDSLPNAVFWKDRDSVYLGCNKIFAKQAGVETPRDIIGRTDYDLAWKKEEAGFFRECDRRVMESNKPEYHILEPQRQADGSQAFLDTNKIPLHDLEGRVVGILGSYEDITEKIEAKKEKEQLESKLRRAEKMEVIGTLAGGVAHDLNNILSGIVSYPELLLLDLPQESSLRKPLVTIQKSGEKATAIVQDLLTLARRGVAVTEVINLNRVISEYLMSLEHERLMSYYPKIEIKTKYDVDLLNIVGSPVHLSKTIMNLISNACEAMPDGGEVLIETANRYLDRPVMGYDDIEEGDYTILKIQDSGVGIAKQDIGRIFEPFYTKKVMGRSGTGLGMAVVWGTVKDHRGYIDVQSFEGKGSIFTLYFPVVRREIPDAESQVTIEALLGHGESLLVVDDIEEQQEIATMMLEKLNYGIHAVSTVKEALDYLKGHTVDLIVLDMIMEPGMDGLDTYRKIIERHPGQKAIIASGFSETDRVREAQRLGAGMYVRKPYTLQKIGLAVRTELEKQ